MTNSYPNNRDCGHGRQIGCCPYCEIQELEVQNTQLKEALAHLVFDLRELMDSSEGVEGLHLNGDVARWNSLTEGGRFEGWLMSLDEAERILEEINK